jgi:hypothetical protein
MKHKIQSSEDVLVVDRRGELQWILLAAGLLA